MILGTFTLLRKLPVTFKKLTLFPGPADTLGKGKGNFGSEQVSVLFCFKVMKFSKETIQGILIYKTDG